MSSPRQPRYPVYVPSKGRSDACLTMRALSRCGIPFSAVVEEQEHDAYEAALADLIAAGLARVLVLPHRDLGVVPSRNWIWDHAAELGAPRYWTMDDNISGFYRYNHNLKVEVGDSSFLAALEDFTDRYENVPVAGMQYHMFVTRKMWWPPLAINTRVYSNMLIETNARSPKTGELYRWEGFYNEDTDLCLRILKDGLCTLLFNAFLIYKQTTMAHSGGNTQYYVGDGRWKMAEELRQKHPDVTSITEKWGRWQHHVDYRRFKSNRLRLRPGALDGLPAIDNYGMELIDERPDEPEEAPKLLPIYSWRPEDFITVKPAPAAAEPAPDPAPALAEEPGLVYCTRTPGCAIANPDHPGSCWPGADPAPAAAEPAGGEDPEQPDQPLPPAEPGAPAADESVYFEWTAPEPTDAARDWHRAGTVTPAAPAPADPLLWDDDEELEEAEDNEFGLTVGGPNCEHPSINGGICAGCGRQIEDPQPEVDPNPQPPVDPNPQPEEEAPAALFDAPPPAAAHHRATVHFESDADIAAFAELTGCPVYPGTRTVTYRRPTEEIS